MSQIKVGIIGVGMMGKPIAENLIRKGFEIIVYDIRTEPLEALQKLGAKVAKSAKEIGELCNVILLLTRDSKQAKSVISGKGGIFGGAMEGSVIVIMRTVEPDVCKKVSLTCAKKGIGGIDSPIAQGPKSAAEVTLTLMVVVEDSFVEKCRPVLEAISNKVYHLGAVGTGQVVKLANNIIAISSYLATTEAIAITTKAGIDLETFLELLRSSSGNTWAAQGQNWYSWMSRNLTGSSNSIATGNKDLHLALGLSKNLGLNLSYLKALAQVDMSEVLGCAPTELFEKT